MIDREEFVLVLRCDGNKERHTAMSRSHSEICYSWAGNVVEASAEFAGETRALAIRAARAAGWLVSTTRGEDGAYCPECHDSAPKLFRRKVRAAIRRGA